MNVVITGASRGIGKAIAMVFAAKGNQLFLTSRSQKALYDTVAEIGTKYPAATVKAKPFDLSGKDQAKEFGVWCLEFGIPDIVVNNAGSFEPGNVYNEPEGVLESQMEINLYSAYHLTRTVIPAMIKRRSGHIFNLCSIASLDAY